MAKPTKKEKDFHLDVMSQGCCVCGLEAIFHHVSLPSGCDRRNHYWGAALCHMHHREYHTVYATVENFEKEYDVNLITEAIRNYWSRQCT